MAKVELFFNGKKGTEFEIAGEPHSELDLLGSKEYKDFYYSVGLGAPITAQVTLRKGVFSTKKYSFEYSIMGNSLTLKDFDEKMQKVKNALNATLINYGIDNDTWSYVYAFEDEKSSYLFYQCFEGICNIGTDHMRIDGKYLVKVEFHEVYGNDCSSVQQSSLASRETIYTELVNSLMKYETNIEIPAKLMEITIEEDAFFSWNQDKALEYFKSRGELNSKSDYGKVEQMMAFNSAYAGMYVANLWKNKKMVTKFYTHMTDNQDIHDLDVFVLNQIGIVYQSEEDDRIFNILKEIMPTAARYSYKVEGANQIQEICCALFRIGITMELNRQRNS